MGEDGDVTLAPLLERFAPYEINDRAFSWSVRLFSLVRKVIADAELTWQDCPAQLDGQQNNMIHNGKK